MKLLFCPFCAYAGGNDLSYLNHIIIMHYNASYGCGKCLKQAFISSLALHTHKKVCQMANQAVVEAIAAMGVLPRSPPKRMARWPPPIPRAQAPLQPLSLHHAAAGGGLPTITSPARRTQVRSKRRQTTFFFNKNFVAQLTCLL